MSPYILVSAAAAGASYTLIPGPAFLALLGIGASQGRRAGAGFLVGHFAGDILWASLALVAIIGTRSISPLVFDALGIVCGVYLCWLGLGALRARPDAEGRLRTEVRRPILRGLAFGLTNPKGYPVSVAMFTALLSGSGAALDWSALPALLLAACLGFVLADVVLVVLVGASWVRGFYRRHAIWISRGSGLIFIGFGAHALIEALPGLRSRS
jgi:threonine/homoserine/homoserine lactone efflux protein